MADFQFQAPGSRKLVDQLRGASISAVKGLGVYAFASAGGIDSFMTAIGIGGAWKPPKRFHMIVGVDAITNADALLRLSDWIAKSLGALTAEVFFHEHPASTFHPKFCIFQTSDGVRVVAGSGNLTTRGLGEATNASIPSGNWEAFGVQDFEGEEASSHWADAWHWIEAERAEFRLRALSDDAVRTQALANGLLRFTIPKSPGPKVGGSSKAAATPALKGPVPPISQPAAGGGKWAATHPGGGKMPSKASSTPAVAPSTAMATALDEPAAIDDLLVKELSKNRPGQADVGKGILESFFGYVPGKATTVLVQYVSLANIVEPSVSKNLFENASSNYRIELGALADFAYKIAKNDARIIIVVVRLAPRSFRYTVVPTTSSQYAAVSALLGPISKATGRKMRSKTFLLAQLPSLWPSAPSNLMPVVTHGMTP